MDHKKPKDEGRTAGQKTANLIPATPKALPCNGKYSGMAELSETNPVPAPPNYHLRHPKYHLIETIRPLIEVHWGV